MSGLLPALNASGRLKACLRLKLSFTAHFYQVSLSFYRSCYWQAVQQRQGCYKLFYVSKIPVKMLTRCSAETSVLQVILRFPNTRQNADTLFGRDKRATSYFTFPKYQSKCWHAVRQRQACYKLFYVSQIPVKMLTRCSAETSMLQVILRFPNISQNAEDHERRWSWSCMRRFFAARAELNPWLIFYIVFWVKTNNYE